MQWKSMSHWVDLRLLDIFILLNCLAVESSVIKVSFLGSVGKKESSSLYIFHISLVNHQSFWWFDWRYQHLQMRGFPELKHTLKLNWILRQYFRNIKLIAVIEFSVGLTYSYDTFNYKWYLFFFNKKIYLGVRECTRWKITLRYIDHNFFSSKI